MDKDYTELITVDELCELLRISHNAAYRILSSGQLDCFKIGRIWKIPRESISRYIKEQSKIM